jgi:hypothetical protein
MSRLYSLEVGNLKEYGDFSWRVSGCEELVAPPE